MRTKKANSQAIGTTDTYFDLVRHFPLVPIRNENAALEAGQVLTDLMMTKPKTKMDAGEQAYMEALRVLLSSFESRQRAETAAKLAPAKALKFLMEESGTNVEGIGKIIGSQPNASLIVNGKRAISKAQALRLAAHFRTSVALFIAQSA